MSTSEPTADARGVDSGPRLSEGKWSVIIMLLVVGSLFYSFLPRRAVTFAPTQVQHDRMLVTAVVRQQSRYIGVGEQGQILIADRAGGPWRSVDVSPHRGSTFTNAAFVAENTVIAVGHDGWVVRSTDAGQTWAEVAFNEGGEPFLGIAGPYQGRLFAFGAFGLLMVSDDLGVTWTRQTLDIIQDDNVDAAEVEEIDPYADPFANFQELGADVDNDRHINDMVQIAGGTLLLVGERGMVLRSTDNGQTWEALPQFYAGSLFGITQLSSGTLLTYGMRGHAYRSTDAGNSWAEVQLPEPPVSLFSGIAGPKGQVLLAGGNGAIFAARDDGQHFVRVSPPARNTITDVLPIKGGWLTAGDGGLLVVHPDTAAGAAQ